MTLYLRIKELLEKFEFNINNINAKQLLISEVNKSFIIQEQIITTLDEFNLEIDNYTNYAMAIRFLPTYWQGIFTGAVYAGGLLFFPHSHQYF